MRVLPDQKAVNDVSFAPALYRVLVLPLLLKNTWSKCQSCVEIVLFSPNLLLFTREICHLTKILGSKFLVLIARLFKICQEILYTNDFSTDSFIAARRRRWQLLLYSGHSFTAPIRHQNYNIL